MTNCPEYGCGRTDCTAPKAYDVSGTPVPPFDPASLSSFSPAVRERLVEDMARHGKETAQHEAAHVLAAALCNRSIDYATLGATPHVKYKPGGEKTEEALMVCTSAGRAAVDLYRHRIASPSHDEMQHFLAKARRGETGSCDECRAAELLVVLHFDEPDHEIMRRWREHYRAAVDLLDTFESRIALSRIAAALEDKTLLGEAELRHLLGWRVQADEA